MSLKLTEKDKKLLVFLAFFVLIVGLGAGIMMPAYYKNLELKQEYAAVYDEEVSVKDKLAQLEGLEAELKVSEDKYAEEKECFFDILSSTDIDRMLTATAIDGGATVLDFSVNIDTENYAAIMPYLGGDREVEASEEEKPLGSYAANVTMLISGEKAELDKIMDTYSAMGPKLRITRFSWGESRLDGGNINLAIDMVLYMAD